MKRDECLNKAMKSVCGGRELDCGSPEDNFAAIADLWTTYLEKTCCGETFWGIDSEDVANMMILFKMGRIMSGTATTDSYVDIAGYAACGCELAVVDEPTKEELVEQAPNMSAPTIHPLDHVITYRGWIGTYEFIKEDNMYAGTLLNARAGDTVCYSGTTLKDMAEHFVRAVKDYVDMRKRLNGENNDVVSDKAGD